MSKYQKQKEIACGGMGTVYLATDIKLGRDVAIKQLHPQYSGEMAFAQRFLREARAMAKLDHPNIIRIWSVEEENNGHFIVMEYFHGADLKNILRNKGTFPVAQCLQITIQILQGLAYAHYMGIIHRDIKPGNILVNDEGKVKITDFGIAAAFEESTLTVAGTVMGTPEYMAPEQARAKAVGPETDIYSVGMVLYEMLTGKTPFKGIPGQTIVGRLIADPDSPFLQFPSTISEELQTLIRNMTKKQVNDRIKDTNEILNILKQQISLAEAVVSPQTEETLITRPEGETVSYSLKVDQPHSEKPPPGSRMEGKPTPPEGSTPSPSPSLITKKMALAGGGIVVFVALTIFTLYIYQDPNSEQPLHLGEKTTTIGPPLLPEPTQSSESLKAAKTAQTNFSSLTQEIHKTQTQVEKAYQAFYSKIEQQEKGLNKDSIPKSVPSAKQWFTKRQDEVQALTQEGLKLDKAQQNNVDLTLNQVDTILQEEKPVLKLDLSPDQHSKVVQAQDSLRLAQQTLQSTLNGFIKKYQARLKQVNSMLADLQPKSEELPMASISPSVNPPKEKQREWETVILTLQDKTIDLNNDIQEMSQKTDRSAKELLDQLSVLHLQAEQLSGPPLEDPGFSQKVLTLESELQTIQKAIEVLSTINTSKKEKWERELQDNLQRLHTLSKKSLDKEHTADVKHLQTKLEDTQKSLKDLPPSAWKKIQPLFQDIQGLLAKANETLSHAKQQEVIDHQLHTLARKLETITHDRKALSRTATQIFELLSQELTTLDQQIGPLAQSFQAPNTSTTLPKLEQKLGIIKTTFHETIAQHIKGVQQLSSNLPHALEVVAALTQQTLTHPQRQQIDTLQAQTNAEEQHLHILENFDWNPLRNQIANVGTSLKRIQVGIQTSQEETAIKAQAALEMETLQTLLETFIQAYESHDLLNLKLTTNMSDARARNLDIMFKTYQKIKAHAEIISTTDQEALATLFMDQLVDKEGKVITPNFIIRETALKIPKQNGKWGKIKW